MYLRAAVILCLLVGWTTRAAAEDRPFRKGPYLQNVSRTSITLVWESSPPMPGTVRLLSTMPPRTIEVEASHDGLTEVVIDQLEPGHRYRYSVECGAEVEEGEFATAPEPHSPLTFIVFGDSRSNIRSHRRVVERIRREVPDFILNTGDMVDDGARERQWQEFFEVERALLRENALFPSLGNHDRQGRGRTADNFRKFFALPENSPDPERYYAFTYANTRIIVLDSNAYSFSLTDQTAWLEQQLQAAQLDPDIDHVFVSMHHPPFSISLHGGQEELRERWTPLFERYGVSAVFSGHDHVYSRAEHGGVYYFVSGGGGAPLYPRGRRISKLDHVATKYFERVNHYVRIHVLGKLVEITAIRADGTIIETMSFGSLPKLEPFSRGPAVAAAGGTDDEQQDDEPDEIYEHVSASPAAITEPADSGRRFGFLGKLGAALIVLAGAVLVRTLRS